MNGILELAKAHKGSSNVAHDLVSNLLASVGDLVQGHSVHLDGKGVLFLLGDGMGVGVGVSVGVAWEVKREAKKHGIEKEYRWKHTSW